MIEDPALFLPFGIHPLWLWGPRLIAAITVVYLCHRLVCGQASGSLISPTQAIVLEFLNQRLR